MSYVDVICRYETIDVANDGKKKYIGSNNGIESSKN